MSRHTPILVRDLKRLYVPTGSGLSKLKPCLTVIGQRLAQANLTTPGEKARRILVGSAPAVVHNFYGPKAPHEMQETVSATFYIVRAATGSRGATVAVPCDGRTIATACTWKEALAVARSTVSGPRAEVLAVNVHFDGTTTSYMEIPAHQEP